MRRDVCGNPAERHFVGSAEELYLIAEAPCVLDVSERYGADALSADGVGIYVFAEAQVSEYADLSRGVDALDVSRRVKLGVAALLRFLKCVLKGGAVLHHTGENEIRSAVQNTIYLVELVSGEALGNRADNRYSAADGGLKEVV